MREKRAQFPGLIERERRREKRESQGFFQRSTEFCWSVFVRLRTIVHRTDEGYAWVPGKRDFSKDPRGEISGDRSCRV